MSPRKLPVACFICFLLLALAPQCFAQSASITDGPSIAAVASSSTPAAPAASSLTIPSTPASSSVSVSPLSSKSSGGSTPSTSSSDATGSTPPDVLLSVPTLSVGRIELDVDNLQADINLNAAVAGLVTINAGVAVSVQKVNLTITDIDAELELIVRLGHLVDIVNRVFSSLDLNPLLIDVLNNATSIVDSVVGAVDGLLGSITQGGKTLSFTIDNLGNIIQEVGTGAEDAVSTIAGNYLTNMTYTGVSEVVSGDLTQKQYSYSPLNALVNIIFNTAGQIVQATVAKQTGSSTTGSAASATSTAASKRKK